MFFNRWLADDLQPYVAAFRRKAHIANQRIPQLRETALGEVLKLTAADLAKPDVKQAVPVCEKSDQVAVAGYGRIQFRSFKVGDARELRICQGIPPKEVRPIQNPARNAETGKDGEFGNRRKPQRLVTGGGGRRDWAAAAVAPCCRAKRRKSTTISRMDW